MRIFNIIVILIATALTQWHGIQFWSEFVGQQTGWAWSISLEVSALWLWFNTGRRRFLAFVASCLLLAGPLFHIIQPTLNNATKTETTRINRTAEINLIRGDITSLEQALATALANSQKRTGWLNDIQASKLALSTARRELRSLLANPVATLGAWPWIKSAMQAAALLIIWAVSVLAISDLTRATRIKTSKPTLINKPVSKKSRTISKRSNTPEITAIVAALDAELNSKGIGQNEWADSKGLSRKNVSLIRHHEQRKKENKETASPAFIQRISTALGVNQLNETGVNVA
ncbi:MAG: hypothetical protein OQK82_05270 [Candidatus Pacearchaeota archaeon]|nr:hypothetical protein [Candidatus Pacearchaeota archaeon]